MRWKGILALAYWCGSQLGAFLSLMWPDIDFEDGAVHVVANSGYVIFQVAGAPLPRELFVPILAGFQRFGVAPLLLRRE